MKNGLEIDKYGNKRWYKDGELHREDGPAVEDKDGGIHWFQYGEYHREDGPAIEFADGTKYWFKDGESYRNDNLPHYENSNGDKQWCYNDEWYDTFEEYMLAKVMR